jgi:uridine phosphorylase
MDGSNVPLLERDSARAAIIEPSRVIKPIDIAEHCVLCFFQEVIREVAHGGAQARQIHNGESEAGDYPVYELDYGGRRLAVVHPGVGAPNAAARLEHMIALGCRKFIACGGAGVLVGSIDVGHIVVPSTAVRDEGTSYHYLPPAREVAPTRRALAAIKAVLRENHHDYISGKTWTTDAVYRETRPRMERRLRFSQSRVSAASSSRKSCTPATASPVGDGLPADGTAMRRASGFFIWPPMHASDFKTRFVLRTPRPPFQSI